MFLANVMRLSIVTPRFPHMSSCRVLLERCGGTWLAPHVSRKCHEVIDRYPKFPVDVIMSDVTRALWGHLIGIHVSRWDSTQALLDMVPASPVTKGRYSSHVQGQAHRVGPPLVGHREMGGPKDIYV